MKECINLLNNKEYLMTKTITFPYLNTNPTDIRFVASIEEVTFKISKIESLLKRIKKQCLHLIETKHATNFVCILDELSIYAIQEYLQNEVFVMREGQVSFVKGNVKRPIIGYTN